MNKERYIGIMSGTSLDGVDIALCQLTSNSCVLESSLFLSFDKSLKEEILFVINGTTTLKQIGEIDHKLALFFSKAVNDLLKQEKLIAKDIRAIGSHGQTLWHEPNSEYPFSMQLGNASILSVQTGIDVVSDFRSKDVAHGGQGAPFAPAFHQFLFSNIKKGAILNIGGMANITILGSEPIGYDTGCGNVLMDFWTMKHKEMDYDEDGAWAKSGNINTKLLKNMLSDHYFSLKFPKSTGREYFNKNFLINYLEPLGKIPNEDIQATLLALTVQSIALEIKKFDIEELLVCGGGVKNIFLMYQLKKILPLVQIKITDEYAVSSDNLEAMIFAWLAYKRVVGEPVELKSITGAINNTILGGIYAGN